MYDSPLLIIPRPMDKRNEPIKNSKPISTSSVPTTRPNGYSSFPPPNSTTTLPHITPSRHLRSLSFMAMNHTPTPLWERPSSLHWKNDYSDSMKPERKLWLPTTLLENSWNPKPYNASFLGKPEIRSGSRPHIYNYTTLLGNLPPKDTVLSRLLRYYLH